jgi:hypothetical protein
MRDEIILDFKDAIAPLRGLQPTPANCETAIKYLNYWATFPEILEVVYGQD